MNGASSAVSGAGTPAWWRKQQLHHELNFANWPIYIDTLNGAHPTLRHFTEQTGIRVSYSEPETDPMPFYAKLRPLLQAGQPTGYDIIVITNNTPVWGFLKSNDWLIPLDQTMMTNFGKYASPFVKDPAWDRGNRYGMAWQSGWTAVGYNSSVVRDPGDSISILFDKKYAGHGLLPRLRLPGSLAPAMSCCARPDGRSQRSANCIRRLACPPSVTAEAPTVFPSQDYLRLSRNYYQFKSQDEVNAWNALFVPITQGS